ncbi:MAG: hypothetical protein LBU58_08225 [Clostridiales bacterium]|jgi:hypothetical protein|nr:hypothetical protein [Clostridiales bacterium]
MVSLTLNDKDNTRRALEIAIDEAVRLSAPLLVATTFGATAVEALRMAQARGIADRLFIITHVYGSRGPGVNAMLEEHRKVLTDAKANLITAAHALSGAERALSTRFSGAYPVEIIAHTLRMFSQGVKVAVEIGAMALDAGAIPYGAPVVAVGGTGHGADTVTVLTPAYTQDIFSTKIHELLCKPY